jgi:polygalacturonase
MIRQQGKFAPFLTPHRLVSTDSTGTLVATEYKVFNVKSYGAKGDGTTDDTAAIQAAIDAASDITTCGVVHFPGSRNSYMITDTLEVNGDVFYCPFRRCP